MLSVLGFVLQRPRYQEFKIEMFKAGDGELRWGAAGEGSGRWAGKIASNSRQCRQTHFCAFCSTYVQGCQVSRKDHLVGLCPQEVGVIFGSQMVTVAACSCEQGGGTRGEQTLLQEGRGRRWPEKQSTRTILGKKENT